MPELQKITFERAYLLLRSHPQCPIDLTETALFSLLNETWRTASVLAGEEAALYEVQGVPFVECKDYFDKEGVKTCLITPFDGHYPFNNYLHHTLPCYNNRVVDFNIVQLKEGEQWEPWLRANNKTFVGHFLGEKSKRIRWVKQSIGPAHYASINSFSLSRQIRLAREYPEPLQNNFIAIGANVFASEVECIVGLDVLTNKIVAAMQCFEYDKGVVGGSITVNQDAQYKPYSLVVCAQLALIREAIAQGKTSVDLGVNFTELGNYKDIIPHVKTPMYNFP